MSRPLRAALGAAALAASVSVALASSHREAPFVTEHPKVDATDFYMFNSYEAGRSDFVTVIANYVPLQAPYGGPNYFALDPDARYEIHFDNNGDGKPDITFTFEATNTLKDIALQVGPDDGAKKTVSIPLINVGPISAGDTSNLNVVETYQVRLKKKGGPAKLLENAATHETTFEKPVDNIGTKSIPDYEAYAAARIFEIDLGDGLVGRVFVGQRKDPFVVNLGEAFDLIHTDPVGPVNGESDLLDDANVTSFCLELPKAFLLAGESTIVGGYTTASLRKNIKLKEKPTFGSPATDSGDFVQVSRLGTPLFNELIVGLKDKDRYNASSPSGDDKAFAEYVDYPTFPELIQVLFPAVTAPNLFPRADLEQVFLTGVDGLNRMSDTQAEMLRLNTAIAAVPAASQNTLGVIAMDTAGYPNGRRPGDDVVDITLRAAMGVLLPADVAPSGALPYTDGAALDATMFGSAFPYINAPLPGATN